MNRRPSWIGEETLDSEDAFLALIDGLFPSRSEHVPFGRGDDCAELAVTSALALSTDFFWQESHFKLQYFTPDEVGAKGLAVAVSDLAAAGAVPLGFSLGLMLPGDLPAGAVRGLMAGMARMAADCGIVLSGGDLSKGRLLGLCVTVWGRSTRPDQDFFLRRTQARPGDAIFLVGPAGLAGAGLALLEREGRAAMETWPACTAAHLTPRPLLAEGQALAELAADGLRLGLMDVSDGLARDLPRLLGGLGADLILCPDILPPELVRYAREQGAVPEELFLVGGEDYALAGTCPAESLPRVRQAVPDAALLGHVRQKSGLTLNNAPVILRGFDHFFPEG